MSGRWFRVWHSDVPKSIVYPDISFLAFQKILQIITLRRASPVTHCTPVDRTMKTVRVGSIGLPIPDTEARIVDLKTGQKTLHQVKQESLL